MLLTKQLGGVLFIIIMLCPKHQKRIKRVCLTCFDFVVCQECLDEGLHSRHHTEMWGKVQKQLLQAWEQTRQNIKSCRNRLKKTLHKRLLDLKKLFQRLTETLQADFQQWIQNVLKDHKENLIRRLRQGDISQEDWQQLKKLPQEQIIHSDYEPRIDLTFEQISESICKIMQEAQQNPQDRQTRSYSKASNQRFYRSSSTKSNEPSNPRRKLSKMKNNTTIKKSPCLFKPQYFSFIQAKYKQKQQDILTKITKNKEQVMSRDSLMQQLIQQKRQKQRLKHQNIRSIVEEQVAAALKDQTIIREQTIVREQTKQIVIQKENIEPQSMLKQLPIESKRIATVVQQHQSQHSIQDATRNLRHHTSILVQKQTLNINPDKVKIPKKTKSQLNRTVNQIDQSVDEQQELKNKLSLIPKTTEFLEQNLQDMEQLWRPYDLMCWTRFFQLRVENNIDDGDYLQQRKKCKGKAFQKDKILLALKNNIKIIKGKTIKGKSKNFLIVKYLLLLTMQTKVLSQPMKYDQKEEERLLGLLQDDHFQQIYRYMQTSVNI